MFFCLTSEIFTYQAVGGNGAEQTVASGSMEVLRPCWAVATSGVPVREQLFNVSICHYTHFNLFQHGELYRSYGQGSDSASLEVATPILIPRSDGHRHRKGSHGDVIFLTNRGEVQHLFNCLLSTNTISFHSLIIYIVDFLRDIIIEIYFSKRNDY